DCSFFFFFSSRRRHTIFKCDWSSDVCSSDLLVHGSNPTVTAIECSGGISVLRMSDGSQLPGSLRVNFKWHFRMIGVVALIRTLPNQAGQTSQFLSAAEGLNVLFQNLFGGWPFRRIGNNFN